MGASQVQNFGYGQSLFCQTMMIFRSVAIGAGIIIKGGRKITDYDDDDDNDNECARERERERLW